MATIDERVDDLSGRVQKLEDKMSLTREEALKSGLLFEFTDKTTLYVNEKTELNANSINTDNGQSSLVINAVCAYF